MLTKAVFNVENCARVDFLGNSFYAQSGVRKSDLVSVFASADGAEGFLQNRRVVVADWQWDRTNPFVIEVEVTTECVDGYGHVSNHHFLRWMTECAFAHSDAVGLPASTCREMRRGMAVRDISVHLSGSAYKGDRLEVANWISKSDGRLRASRQFQIVNVASGKTLARGEVDFVCTNLDNGRPVKMPAIFATTYVVQSSPIDSSAEGIH
jgi:acyl-CoA thioester hydrolase